MNSQERILGIKYLKNVLKVLNRIPNPDLKLRASVVLESSLVKVMSKMISPFLFPPLMIPPQGCWLLD